MSSRRKVSTNDGESASARSYGIYCPIFSHCFSGIPVVLGDVVGERQLDFTNSTISQPHVAHSASSY